MREKVKKIFFFLPTILEGMKVKAMTLVYVQCYTEM